MENRKRKEASRKDLGSHRLLWSILHRKESFSLSLMKTLDSPPSQTHTC